MQLSLLSLIASDPSIRPVYTLHVREKPARPFVAITTCALLLAGLTYGAWQFSRVRTDAMLGPEISPLGWPLVFRLAGSWRRVNEDAADADRQLIYWRDDVQTVPSKLIVRRIPISNRSTAKVCEQSLREYFGVFEVAGRRRDEPTAVALGQLDGSFLVAPERGYIVFVGTWRRGQHGADEYWVIEFSAAPPLWRADVQFFTRFAESFRPA